MPMFFSAKDFRQLHTDMISSCLSLPAPNLESFLMSLQGWALNMLFISYAGQYQVLGSEHDHQRQVLVGLQELKRHERYTNEQAALALGMPSM